MRAGAKVSGGRTAIWVLAGLLGACGGPDGPPVAVLIENVTLIDGTDTPAQPGMSVAVDGDRIVAVGRTGKLKVGAPATKIDGKGMYLIPGLWDMHVHLGAYRERAMPLFLANGVTTIREVGGDLKEIGYVRQEVRAGRMLGPDMLIAGPILDSPIATKAWPKGRLAVPTPAVARRAVDSLAEIGVDLIKVHSSTPRAAYFAILDQARQRGLLVAGHVPDSVSPQEAIDSGQRTIEHDWGIGLANSSRGPALGSWLVASMTSYLDTAKTRFKIWPYLAYRYAVVDSALASYDWTTALAFAKGAAGKDVWFDPTLFVVQTQMVKNEPKTRDFPELRFVPKAAREFEDGEPPLANPTAADLALGRARWTNTLRTFRALVEARAKFVAGTDATVMPLVPGFSLHHELALLVEMGLTAEGALQAATRNAALAMKKPDIGTIEPGKVASMVLLSADPLADIHNVKAIQTVMLRGRLLDRAVLDRMLRDAEAYAKQ